MQEIELVEKLAVALRVLMDEAETRRLDRIKRLESPHADLHEQNSVEEELAADAELITHVMPSCSLYVERCDSFSSSGRRLHPEDEPLEWSRFSADLQTQAGGALRSFLRRSRSPALGFVSNASLLQREGHIDSEVVSALCAFDEVLENCGSAGVSQYLSVMMPLFLRYAPSTNAELRQSAVYGIGVCAQVAADAFHPHVAAARKAFASRVIPG
jgi:hypothetical protein